MVASSKIRFWDRSIWKNSYELWLIPTSGAPLPAGVFKPDAHGSATVINPPLPTGVEAKAFAMTIEPDDQGSPLQQCQL